MALDYSRQLYFLLICLIPLGYLKFWNLSISKHLTIIEKKKKKKKKKERLVWFICLMASQLLMGYLILNFVTFYHFNSLGNLSCFLFKKWMSTVLIIAIFASCQTWWSTYTYQIIQKYIYIILPLAEGLGIYIYNSTFSLIPDLDVST